MHASTRIALALIVGIWTLSLVHSLSPGLWIVVASGALVALLGLLGRKLSGRAGALRGALIVMLIGGALLSLSLEGQRRAEESHASELDDRIAETVRGRVAGPVTRFVGRQQFVLQTPSAAIWMTLYREEDGAWPTIVPGQELAVRARLSRPIGLRALGASDRRMQVMARGAQLVATASADEVVILSRDVTHWYWAGKAHDWAVQTIAARPGSARGRALVAAIATGDRSAISQDLAAELRVAGIAHLLAVSGMHLAAVASLVFAVSLWLWAWLPWRQRFEPQAVAAALALLAAVGFTAITGARPSTCRALLVASFVLGGILLQRRIRLLHALSWAASLLLLWRPVLLWDVGFQMSFAAAIALALAFRKREEPLAFVPSSPWRSVGRALRDLFRASFWACMATAPISLYHFGELSWIGLASNLVAVPLATFVLLPCALGGLLLEAVVSGAGRFFLDVAIAVADHIAQATFWFHAQQGSVMRSPLSSLELLLWAFTCIVLLAPRTLLARRKRWLCTGLLVSILLASRHEMLLGQDATRASLRVTFVEVGQGDAALVETPDGEVWLVDGGGLPFVAPGPGVDAQYMAESPARMALLPLLRHKRIDHIDLAIVSHPHPDHYVGLQAIARAMPIRELWTVHEARPGPYEAWLAQLQEQGTTVRAPALGVARQNAGASVEVLWPRFHAEAGRGAEVDPILTVNDNSLVVRIDFAGRRVLFAGDIEEEAEELLVARDSEALRADVVKVPHHGSRTSSSVGFVRATEALVAVISCGRANRFEFPDSGVQERWAAQADLVLRTDEVGSVTLTISPTGLMHLQTRAPF